MKTLSTLCCLTFFHCFLLAQVPDSTVSQFSLNFTPGIPTGDFASKMDDNAYGLDVAFLTRIKQSPVFAGARFGYLHFSRYKIDVDEPIGDTGFNSEYDWITASQALMLGAAFRVKPGLPGPVSPYFQGEVGARRLYTNTRLVDRYDTENNRERSNLELADWAMFYSGKAGVQILLTRDRLLALDLGCTYAWSGNADFYRKKENPGPVASPQDAFELRSANSTALLIPSIGFSFNIPKGGCDE